MRLIYIGLAIFITTSCASNNAVVSQEPVAESRHFSNIHHPVKDGTLEFVESKRLGAAYGVKGYTHVLAIREDGELNDEALKAKSADLTTDLFSLESSDSAVIDSAKIIEKVDKISYSIYEMSRWERFCGHGNMDERDWVFIAKQGRNNLPVELASRCTEPAYTRQDYLAAWNAICIDEDTEMFFIIRNQSISPKAHCKN